MSETTTQSPSEGTALSQGYIGGARQYLRAISLQAGIGDGKAVELSGLRVNFKVVQYEISTPNIAWIKVNNVSPETSQKIKTGEPVILKAGYKENFGRIFQGIIKQVRRGRDNPTDTYVEIGAQDADTALNWGVANVTLAAGYTTRDVIDALVRTLAPFGITLGPVPENMPNRPAPRGRSLMGMARDYIRMVADDMDCNWSIINNVLTFTPRGGYAEGDIVVLTSRTGMVGMPEQTDEGIMVRCLLNPNILAGRRVKIDQASVQQARFDLSYTGDVRNNMLPSIANDGMYRVIAVNWSGDTHGQDWYSELTCVSLDPSAQLPVSAAQRGRPL